MNASQKVISSLIWSLFDCLRGTSLNNSEQAILALQLLAWAKLSKDGVIPEELRLTEKTKFLSNLESVCRELRQCEFLGENQFAFENLWFVVKFLKPKIFIVILDIVYEFLKSSHLNSFELLDSLLYCFQFDQRLPSEVSRLMLYLAGSLEKKRVYCPYDTYCDLARRADQDNADVYIESQLASPIPSIINILVNTKIHVKFTNLITHPGYITEDGKLEQFDITLAFPPFGMKYDKEVIEKDWFGRFSERTSSGSVLNIRHILAHTKDKAVIAIPNNILFSRGAEHSLRQDLIRRGIVSAIIAMPPAILSFTSVQFSILILNCTGGQKTIRFVNGSHDRFYERDGKGRSQLINWKDLLKLFSEKIEDEALVRDVSIEDVIQNDAYLEVSRYLLPPKQKRVNQILQKAKTTQLDKLVSFIRPSQKIQGEGNILAYEVSVSDFPDFGYIKTPQRAITLASKAFESKDEEMFLKPGDILIATKGSVGKVAIVSENVPSAGEGGWLVNQSCMILRSKEKIEPQVLFMYLCSDLGQILLANIVSGATVPLIQLRALQKLKVIIPSVDEAKRITEIFNSQVELQKKIDDLRHEQHELAKENWGIEIEDSRLV